MHKGSVAYFCLIISLLSTSCSTYSYLNDYHDSNLLIEKVDWTKAFDSMAEELCTDSSATPENVLQECSKLNATYLVTDFVDIQTYVPCHNGFLFGELMRSSLSKRVNARIVEAEFSKYFKLSEKGLVVLTRTPQEIKFDSYPPAECIVGTYSFTGRKIFLFVRRINPATGMISKIVSREIDLTRHTFFGI